jgi:hypothetical protein
MDHFNLSSSGNGDRFLNSSVNFPAEMRYKMKSYNIKAVIFIFQIGKSKRNGIEYYR